MKNTIPNQIIAGARDGALVSWIVGALFVLINAFFVPKADAIMAYPGSAMTTTCMCGNTSYTMSPYTGGGMWIFTRLMAM